MADRRQLDRESVRKAVEKARLIVAARAEFAALEAEPLVEFRSVDELFAVVDERVRAVKAAMTAETRELAHA